MLFVDFDETSLVVTSAAAEVLRVQQVCSPAHPSCFFDPAGWLVGSSLWVSVRDGERLHLIEVDLTTGTMAERVTGNGVAVDSIVQAGSGIRLTYQSWEADSGRPVSDGVLDVSDGRIESLLQLGAAEADIIDITLDRFADRAVLTREVSSGWPLGVGYEVIDLRSGQVTLSGTVELDLTVLHVSDLAGDRLVFNEFASTSDTALLDVVAGRITYASRGPGCLLADGTAVFEAFAGGSGLEPGPLTVVGVGGSIVETATLGAGYGDGRIACGLDSAVIHAPDGSVTLMTAGGAATPLELTVTGMTLLQVGGGAPGLY